MAFAEKYFIEHKTQVRGSTTTTTTTRIELHQDGFVGSATELDGRGDFWTHEWENLDPENLFKEPVQKSRLEMHINISDATDKAILTDIFAGDDDDYRLIKKVNGTIVWTGSVITDLLEYPEGGYPFRGTIIAKDLSIADGYYYTADGTIDGALQSGEETIITTIADLLSYTGYGLDIHTYTSWKEDNMADATDDFLNEVKNDVYALREYANTGDEEDRPIKVFRAIKEICRNHALILRQAGGAWRLYHRSALSDPTAVDEYIYDSTGTQTAKNTGVSQVDISANADRIVRYILPKTRNKFNKGLKSASVRYDHRTEISGIKLPSELNLTSSRSFTQTILSNGNQSIELFLPVIEATSTQSTGDLFAEVKISSGSQNYDGREWTASNVAVLIPLELVGPTTEGASTYKWVGSKSITTRNIPASADGTLEIEFRVPFNTSSIYYRSPSFNIRDEIVLENSTAIQYELVQGSRFSGELEYGSVWYGDGPTENARGALIVGSDITIDTWYRKGESTLINHSNLLLREIIDNQRTATRNIRADLYGSYIPDKVLVYDSGNFFFLGGQQTGKQNRWDADFSQIDTATGVDDFLNNPQFDSTQTGTQFLIDSNYVDVSNFEKNAITQLRNSIDGDQSILPVEYVSDAQFFKGDKLLVVNILTAETKKVTVSQDTDIGATSIPIEVANFDNFPERSFVVGTGQFASTGIAAGRNAVRIFAESTAIGILTSDVLGEVTSIDVELYATVRNGDDLEIVNLEDNLRYSVVVDETDPVSGDVTLSIQEQFIDAPAGSYIVGDQVRRQAELEVSPGRVQASIETERQSQAIGTYDDTDVQGTVILAGTTGITSLKLTNVDGSVSVQDNQKVLLKGKRPSEEQIVVVNGNQTITDGSSITLDSFTNSFDIDFQTAVIEPAYSATSRLTVAENKILLKVDSNGDIASVSLLAGADTGSSISINADQITVAGQTTFISALQGEQFTTAGDTQDFAGDGVTFQDTPTNFPTTRSDGEALQSGDIAWDTSYGRKPYRYNGTSWERAYSIIDGGDIIANTITASEIAADTITATEVDVDDLFTQTITVTGSISSDNYSAASAGFTIDGTTGNAEFNDVTVRGTLGASSISEGLNFGTSGSIRSSSTALDGTDAGALFNDDGFFAGAAGQTKANANVRILSTGNAEFKGTVTADDGEIGGFTIGANTLTTTNFAIGNSTQTYALQAGSGNEFTVTHEGALNATSATIAGDITATSGSLSGLDIDGTLTMSGSGSIRSASSGQRVEISNSDNLIDLFNSNGGSVRLSGGGTSSTAGFGIFTISAGNGIDTDFSFSVAGGGGVTCTGITNNGDIEIDGDLNHDGSNLGFYGTAPTTKVTISGIETNQVLVDLLAALDGYGLITDSTTRS